MAKKSKKDAVEQPTKVSNLEKRKPKGPVKFNIQLNEEQKEAKSVVMNHPVTFITGGAGSGKTLISTQIALDMLFNREVERIIIARPAVATEDLGFLPGSADDKLMPYLRPVLDNFYKIYHKEHIDKLFKDEIISIVPFAFMRGLTFTNALIIVDEAQNLDLTKSEMVLGRLGLGSKMIICGDDAQIDLKNPLASGIFFLGTLSTTLPDDIGFYELKQNHRHPAVARILTAYKVEKDKLIKPILK